MTTIQSDRQHPSWIFAAPDKILVATDLDDLGYLVPYAIAQGESCGTCPEDTCRTSRSWYARPAKSQEVFLGVDCARNTQEDRGARLDRRALRTSVLPWCAP